MDQRGVSHQLSITPDRHNLQGTQSFHSSSTSLPLFALYYQSYGVSWRSEQQQCNWRSEHWCHKWRSNLRFNEEKLREKSVYSWDRQLAYLSDTVQDWDERVARSHGMTTCDTRWDKSYRANPDSHVLGMFPYSCNRRWSWPFLHYPTWSSYITMEGKRGISRSICKCKVQGMWIIDSPRRVSTISAISTSDCSLVIVAIWIISKRIWRLLSRIGCLFAVLWGCKDA